MVAVLLFGLINNSGQFDYVRFWVMSRVTLAVPMPRPNAVRTTRKKMEKFLENCIIKCSAFDLLQIIDFDFDKYLADK